MTEICESCSRIPLYLLYGWKTRTALSVFLYRFFVSATHELCSDIFHRFVVTKCNLCLRISLSVLSGDVIVYVSVRFHQSETKASSGLGWTYQRYSSFRPDQLSINMLVILTMQLSV